VVAPDPEGKERLLQPNSRTRNIFTNAGALVAASLLTRVLSVPVLALLVRTLSKEDFGQYSYLISFVNLFSALVTLGLPAFLAREVVQQRDRASVLMKAAYLLELLLSGLTVVLILFVGQSSQSQNAPWLLAMAAVGMAAAASATIFQYTINGLNYSYITAVIQVVSSLFNSLGLLLATFFSPSVESLILVFFLSGILQHILSFWSYQYYFKEIQLAREWPTLQTYSMVLRNSLPYVFLVAFASIYFRIDIVLLEQWSTIEELANYSAAYKFIDIIQVIVGLIGGVFFAEFSNMYAREETGSDLLLKRGFRYMVLISLPLASLLTFYATDILQLFYGAKYVQSAGILQILGWTVVLLFACNLQNALIQAQNYVQVQVFVYGISSVLNIVLNYFLIPLQGALGASIATLLCELFNFSIFSLFLFKQFRIQLFGWWMVPAFAAFAVMQVVLSVCSPWPAPLGITAGVLGFAAALLLCGGVLPEDIGRAKQIFRRFSLK